jgi:hypothetical protein
MKFVEFGPAAINLSKVTAFEKQVVIDSYYKKYLLTFYFDNGKELSVECEDANQANQFYTRAFNKIY